MTHILYKKTFLLLATCFFINISAQKFDKKFTENFTVNKDVEVVINASKSDINVTTWNKNEVQVEASIEIEGLSKEEAEKYFKKWNFEALGNKSKVKLTSQGSNASGLKNDIVFLNNMNFDFEMPEIKMPDFDAIVIPDMNFNFDFDFDYDFDLDDLERDMKKENDYKFEYHKDDKHIVIKTKEEWGNFKNSKEYKSLKENFRNARSKMKSTLKNSKEQVRNINKEQIREALEEAKLQIKNINTKEIQKGLLMAQEALKNMKFSFNSGSDDLTINGKKIIITKKIDIKVPKGATFDLNTRHCKVKLPNTVASGNVKYGAFNANNLLGGKLTVEYSPVNINSLNACTLYLNNVTDAKIASVTNTSVSSNSSDVEIKIVHNDVNVSDKFGSITIADFSPNFGLFVLNLSNSEAILNLGKISSKYKYNMNKVKLNNERVKYFNNSSSTKNLLKVNGEYSCITIK